jgi:tetratricopeptide (TPR) repeat protein
VSLQADLQAALGDTYRIRRELGGGGMGRVFVAEETRLGREVVIKVLSPDMAASVNVERFEREIQLAARLQHPHIVPLLTTGGSGSLLYYVMPYIAGESLRGKLTREGELPIAEAVKILLEVTDALAYAHRHGVVHRDIKPDNVLLSEGHAVVTDFGVAKAVSASSGSATLTSLGVALGTPAYMAPEQAAADPNTDHRADIYALGALAYEMLTGRTPFTAPTPQALLAAHITQTPDPVTRHRPAVPAPLAALIMRCLEKHAADRWQSAGEVVSQLQSMSTPSGGMPPTGTTPVISSGTEDAIRRAHPARVAALFAAAAVGVLSVVYLLVRLVGLPDWVFGGAVALLVLGLPIMLVTGYLERRRAQARASGRATSTPAGGLRALFTWTRALRGGMLAFAALGMGTAGWMLMRALGVGPVGTLVAKGRLAAKDRLVVADFENRTADAGLGQSLTEAFRIDLAQTRIVTLVSSATVADALGRMQRDPNTPLTATLARDVAAREGAKAVVSGDISAVGQGFVLSARLVDAGDGTELAALRETADDDRGLVAAIDRLSKRLRERIGESLRSIRAGQPLERVTTASLPALKLYSDGVRAFNQSDYSRAATIFEQALALDSNFAMAWRKLGVSRLHLGASRDLSVAALRRANTLSDRLPEIERLQTEAFYQWNVTRDNRRAAATYRRVLALDPDDGIALNNLSEILGYNLRQFAAAESLMSRTIQVDPGGVSYWDQVDFQLAQAKVDEARQTLARFGKAFPASYDYAMARAWFPAGVGDYDSAQRTLVNVGLGFRDPAQQADVHFNLAALTQIQGKLTEAERQYQQYSAIQEQRSDLGSALYASGVVAFAYSVLRHDSAGALRVIDAALARHRLDQITPLARPYAVLIMTYAVAGRPSEARRLLADYESTRPEEVHNLWGPYLRGYVALAEGKSRDAIAAFQESVERSPICNACGYWELGLAFDEAGQPDSALIAYERVASDPGLQWEVSSALQWTLAPSLRRLGELYEARGDRAKAAEYYGRFVNLWRDADPALQPAVREVRARIARLTSEGR